MTQHQTQLPDLTAAQCRAAFANKTLSPRNLLEAVLTRLEACEPMVNAFVLVDRDAARAAALASEKRWAAGAPLGPADGLIATIKDNIALAGYPMRRGSLTTPDTIFEHDAPIAARLREAGAIILGKTTLPEFGWKGCGDSPQHGITRNPWSLNHTSGGSSAGAAVSAALGLGHFHVGTDGAGSIRIPAAFCGVFGIKPSFGRVPAWPASPFNVVAHLGPITRTVADGALMLSIIGQPDARDNLALISACPDYTDGLESGIAGRRIAWSPRLDRDVPVDPDVAEACARAAKLFESLGAHVEEVDPPLPDTQAMMDVMWKAGAGYVLSTIDPTKTGLCDPGFLAEATAGARLPASAYIGAFSARAALAHTMHMFHQRFDLLLSPQMPTGAIPAGRIVPPGGPYKEWMDWSPFTYPFNLTQQPACSVPCGLTRDGLPIGLQIVGPMHADALVLRAAFAFEQAQPFAFLSAPRNP